MRILMTKLKKIIPLLGLVLALVLLGIVGAIPSETALAIPQMGNQFYGNVTTLTGDPVPYDSSAPTDPAQTTMVYARNTTRVLNFDGRDEFSSGEYYGRPVTMNEVTGMTRYGWGSQSYEIFTFPAYDPQDPAVQGARPGDKIQFYICPPGCELPGVLVTDPVTGEPVLATFLIGGSTLVNLSADIVPPAPEAVNPLEGAVDVERDEPIWILFDEEIFLVEPAAFHIVGSISGDLLAGDPILEADGRTVTLPHLDFDDFGETVTVTIDAGAVEDGVGNLNEVYSWSFATYPYFITISGNAGVEGVELKDDADLLLATSGPGGFYSFAVQNGWTGTVTPVLEGYVFEPAFRSYDEPVIADMLDQDYVATLLTFTISGNAGMEGVELKDGAGVVLATTDADGNYSFTVDYGWTGTVTPVLEGYEFEPAFRSYTNVTENLTGQDYTTEVEAYLIYFPLFVH